MQNPNGYVVLGDGGAPRQIGGYAREAMSGGQFAYASGATTAVIDSGASSFATADVLFAAGASGGEFTGIVVTPTVASGAPVTVATRGMFICTADGDVTPGQKLITGGGNAVASFGSVAGNLGAARTIGRALTPAGSEGYCVVDLHG